MTKQTQALYRKFRAHQATVAASGGGTVTTYPTGRTERSYASAPYGEHALSAFIAAKRHAHFMITMTADVKASKKRSASAKRAWKARKLRSSSR